MARDWRYTKLCRSSAHFRVARVLRVCTMSVFFFHGFPERLCIILVIIIPIFSGIRFFCFVLFFVVVVFPFIAVFSCFFVFLFFSCSRWSFVDDVPLIFTSTLQQTTYQISNGVYYWVRLKPDQVMWRRKNTHTNTDTQDTPRTYWLKQCFYEISVFKNKIRRKMKSPLFRRPLIVQGIGWKIAIF